MSNFSKPACALDIPLLQNGSTANLPGRNNLNEQPSFRPYSMPNGPGNFYLLDNKLLYVYKEFVGFNPAISKSLRQQGPATYGTNVEVDKFDMPGSSFTVILIKFRGSGPLRGYEAMEILNNGKTLIRYKKGGGMGGVYEEGNNLLVNYTDAYLVVVGSTLKKSRVNEIYPDIDAGGFYFFWFTDVIIPAVEEIIINYDSVPEKESYTIQEIKHLRQLEWYAEAIINNHEVVISKSFIPGFSRIHRNSPGYEKFRKDNAGDMSELDIVIDGIFQLNEK